MQVYRIFHCFCHNILASFCGLNSDILFVQGGTQTFESLSANSHTYHLIKFEKPFTEIPKVSATLNVDGTLTNVSCGIRHVGKEAFHLYARNNNTDQEAGIVIDWVAIGK